MRMNGAALVARGPVSGISPALPGLSSYGLAHLLLSALLSFGFAAAYYVDATDDGKILSVLGILLALGTLHAALYHPDRYPLLLVAYLPYNVLYPFGWGESVGLNMTNLLLGLGGVAWISSRLRRPERLPLGVFELLLFTFAGMGLLNVAVGWVWSGGPTVGGESLDRSLLDQVLLFKRWAMPFVLFFVVRGVLQDRRGINRVLSAMMWTTFLVALLTWSDGTQGGRGSIDGSRVEGILLQPNSMGTFLAYYGMSFLGLCLATKGLGHRAVLLAGFLVALRASLFTFSRGAYVAFVSGSTLVLLLHNPLILAGAIGVSMSFPEMIPESVRSRVGKLPWAENIYDDSLTARIDKSIEQRFVLWRAGVEMSLDSPLFGVGLGNFSEMVDQYTEVPLPEDSPRDAHSAYLLTAAELGIPMLIAMVIVLLWLGASTVVLYFKRDARKDRALSLAFLGTWAATVTSCVWGSRFSDGSVIGYFWILAALVIVLRHLGRTSVETSR